MNVMYDEGRRIQYASDNDKEFKDYLLHKVVDRAWQDAQTLLEYTTENRTYPCGTFLIVKDLVGSTNWFKVADGKRSFNELPFVNTEYAKHEENTK